MQLPLLSDAIMLGSMLKKQGFGAFMRHYREGDQVEERTCAWGAAADALGKLETSRLAEVLKKDYAWTADMFVPCPTRNPYCYSHVSVMSTIEHLNDCHRWSREAIASWVATIEPKPGPETSQPEAVPVEQEPVCVA